MVYEGGIENTEDIAKEMQNHTEGINKSACHALGMCKGCKVSHPKSCYTPKYKNETTRFLGDGVSFKAKLIGILEVSEARGDRMCQEALSDLKMAIRAAGEHKQRITINIAIDGLRLRDEKTGDSLYHHPVHKISFIAQDMTDSRAFGYIFGSPDTGHRFFGIKTDKAANQVVIAMRDLFQVVFALKKKEIELAKQHLEKSCYPSSPLFSDSSSSSSKLQSVPNVSIKSAADAKASSANDPKNSGTAVADLVDLELELSSLQQGLNQMERITPSDPFGSKDDPFGDSFISYPTKAILPPPPSSGKERSSRISESSSIFSPKTPHTGATVENGGNSDKKKDFSFSHDFSSSHEEPSSGDWFTPSGGNSIFEEPSPLPPPEPTKDEKHEQAKQDILSQFDVFTDLDPLELKNPPKKALNDLVSTVIQDPPLFGTNFNQKTPKKIQGTFTVDPFGEDPFVKEDPFADSDFSKQDPFETEFSSFPANGSEKFGNEPKKDTLQSFVPAALSKSPKGSMLETQIPPSTSPKTISFSRQSTFDIQFSKLSHSHENPSLDVSSEGECAPEPPPRPASNVMYIKPPPLPPKKQTNDLAFRPPPRPPYYGDEPAYEFIDKYETAANSVEKEKSPPLPVPARKAKFDSDYPPERPRKHFNVSLSEEDYLTPISFPDKGPALLPPPQKSTKKSTTQVTVSSMFEPKPSVASEGLGTSLDGLDITLSQLTLSGLNELARKLNIPASQLSNMTLVQLTNFLSNFIKSSNTTGPSSPKMETLTYTEFPSFQADFAANFSNSNSTSDQTTYDRYAVFRELMQEEIKQTKIDSEPEEILEEKEKLENSANSNVNLDLKPMKESEPPADRYAALREIVEIELRHSESEKEDLNRNEIGDIAEEEEDAADPKVLNGETCSETENLNMINRENTLHVDVKEEPVSPVETNIIEYMNGAEVEIIAPVRSPVKSIMVKSPVPSVITEIVQNNTRLTSGSLSDVVSGSSPEVDNTASNSDAGKKAADAAGESWAIFDQGTIPVESVTEKQAIQSEEGVSPWSSDSKEFGNGSPPGWRSKDSGSGTEQYPKKRRDKEGWWDTSADPEVHYCPSNRRSTDSYDEEYRECYDRPRRRRQQTGNWQHGGQTTGGHSSSSRDVSPWEEEPRKREVRDVRDPRAAYRYTRGHSFERHRDRRPTDSWDEDDDYEYDAEHARFHWSSRHVTRDTDVEGRHSTGTREHENDRWCEDRSEDRRHRRRRDVRDRWCCPDWEQTEHEKPPRYGVGRWTPSEPVQAKWRERKNDERYYSRESQDSPWEDEYSNEPENSPHYLSKRNWKRPSSASEMDRKTGEIKTRHHLGTGGSDGERADRRYKPGRRSRSRDSQYSEPSHRHKPELGPSMRSVHRSKPHAHSKTAEAEFSENSIIKKTLDVKLEGGKKTSTLSRKKTKDSPKTEESAASTFPRKSNSRGKMIFENDFVMDDSPAAASRTKFNFDNDFETSETESPIVTRPVKTLRQQTMFEKSSPPLEKDFKDRPRGSSLRESKISPRYQNKSKSHFEDDFSPSEKSDQQAEEGSIPSIKEEMDRENEDEFSASNFENATNGRKKILSKNRLSGGLRTDNLKKSESVNIFAREDDPFDDDFFCGEEQDRDQKPLPRSSELRWTDDFEN